MFVELGRGVVWKNSELERIGPGQLKGGQVRVGQSRVLLSGYPLPLSLHSSTSKCIYENNTWSCLVKGRRAQKSKNQSYTHILPAPSYPLEILYVLTVSCVSFVYPNLFVITNIYRIPCMCQVQCQVLSMDISINLHHLFTKYVLLSPIFQRWKLRPRVIIFD